MSLNINDTFSSLTLLQNAVKQYSLTLPFKFNQPVTHKKLFTMNCIGKKDFHCDALIQAILRKKDNLWVIKKIKLQHKCPNEIHFIGSEAYIFKKVNEIQEIKEEVIRPGVLVKMLEERGCKIGYSGVYNAYKKMREIIEKENIDGKKDTKNNKNIDNMNEKEDDNKNEKENDDGRIDKNNDNKFDNNINIQNDNNIDNNRNDTSYDNSLVNNNTANSNNLNTIKDNINNSIDNKKTDLESSMIKLAELPDTPYDSFIYELKMLNKFNAKILADISFIFMQFNDLKNLTRNVIEVKMHEKLDGYVIYAILFDPHDFPIIYACIVTELDLKESFRVFFKELSEGFNIIVEYNREVIEILEEMNVEYFVKVRDICKELYKIDKDKGVIESVYGICNGIIKREGGYEKRERRKKRKTEEMVEKEGSDDKGEKENIEMNNYSVFHGNAFNNISSSTISALKGEANKQNNIVNINNEQNTDTTVPLELDTFTYDKIIQNIQSLHNINEKRFIKERNYFGLQNMHEIDLDYINSSVYNLEMIECFNGIISMLQISEEKEDFGSNVRIRIEKNKKIANKEKYEIVKKTKNTDEQVVSNENTNKNINNCDETFVVVNGNNKEYTVIPDKFYCSCGMFQSLLIPCAHACSFLENPFDYVSILYSKKYFLFDYNVTPVIEDVYKNEKGRYLKMVKGSSKRKRVRKEKKQENNNE